MHPWPLRDLKRLDLKYLIWSVPIRHWQEVNLEKFSKKNYSWFSLSSWIFMSCSPVAFQDFEITFLFLSFWFSRFCRTPLFSALGEMLGWKMKSSSFNQWVWMVVWGLHSAAIQDHLGSFQLMLMTILWGQGEGANYFTFLFLISK